MHNTLATPPDPGAPLRSASPAAPAHHLRLLALADECEAAARAGGLEIRIFGSVVRGGVAVTHQSDLDVIMAELDENEYRHWYRRLEDIAILHVVGIDIVELQQSRHLLHYSLPVGELWPPE